MKDAFQQAQVAKAQVNAMVSTVATQLFVAKIAAENTLQPADFRRIARESLVIAPYMAEAMGIISINDEATAQKLSEIRG